MPNLKYVEADDDFYRVLVKRTMVTKQGTTEEQYYIGPHTHLGRLKAEVTRHRKNDLLYYPNSKPSLEVIQFEKMSSWEVIEVE